MRFALLKHTTSSESNRRPHLDLLLQSREAESPDDRCLITFEIPLEPAYWDGLTILRLELHRAIYLDYTGEIEGNRGSVEKFDSGPLVWTTQASGELLFSMRLANPRYQRNSGTWQFLEASDGRGWIAQHLRSVEF